MLGESQRVNNFVSLFFDFFYVFDLFLFCYSRVFLFLIFPYCAILPREDHRRAHIDNGMLMKSVVPSSSHVN